MANLHDLSAQQMAELADRLTRISMALFEYRVSHQLEPDEERLIREHGELQLDALANLLRGHVIENVVDEAIWQASDLVDALEDARRTITNIQSVKDAIHAITNVVSLAGALLSRDPQAIVKTLKPFAANTEDMHNI